MTSARGRPALIFIVGPTASGKSQVALELAERWQAEIVNADAMQLYRGMDIGTAKLPLIERRGIPHHMIDVLEVSEEASVAEYQRQTRLIIDDRMSQGLPVIVVGGSGLYVKSIIDALHFPGTDPVIRSRLENEAEELGASAMHARLAKVDPAAAMAILPGNVRRVVRALEVVELTGLPFTATLPRAGNTHYADALQIGVDLERPTLDERIEHRVDQMWKAGFVEEVAGLAEIGLREGKTARGALGYLQVLRALDGASTLETARAETKLATRKFARRQLSWFRRDDRIHWSAPHEAVARAESLAQQMSGSSPVDSTP